MDIGVRSRRLIGMGVFVAVPMSISFAISSVFAFVLVAVAAVRYGPGCFVVPVIFLLLGPKLHC